MTKLKSTVKYVGLQYYDTSNDMMWKSECDKLIPWIYGKGADLGCGQRSINRDMIRVDIDPKVKPDVLAEGHKLPFADGELDYVTAMHNFEHYDNQFEVFKEWIRVLKKGGIIAMVHPDVRFTKQHDHGDGEKGYLVNPFNRHYHEHTLESFLNEINQWKDLGFKIIDSGPACINWSFYLIIEKI